MDYERLYFNLIGKVIEMSQDLEDEVDKMEDWAEDMGIELGCCEDKEVEVLNSVVLQLNKIIEKSWKDEQEQAEIKG